MTSNNIASQSDNEVMPFLSEDALKSQVANISEQYDCWLSQWGVVSPENVLDRRRFMRGLKCLFQAVVGTFIRPFLSNTNYIYIFEGLRNKEYMAVFSPDTVVIVGSHIEKEYAHEHGYGFAWSFPMQSAIHTKISRNWNYPAIRQLIFWKNKLSKFDKAIFFLYEDTQPLGAFFVYVSRLLPSNVSSVCIQHGYFLKYHYPIRIDGAISDFNFVWDMGQAELIGGNILKTYEIGLPYFASAKSSHEFHVILVGTGMARSCRSIYELSITTYLNILNMLVEIPGVTVFYRPHPNEYNDEKLLLELSKLFKLVENTNKVDMLNGPRGIFIGGESSLLFEAGIAGHLVAHLKLDASIPAFNFDFQFETNGINELQQWVLSIKNSNSLVREIRSEKKMSPLERFSLALREMKLVN